MLRLQPLLILLAVAPATFAQPPAKDDPVIVRARELTTSTPKLDRYVFTDDQFPAVEKNPMVKSVTFYDRQYQPVDKATNPGPYVAVVEVTP